jgi:hypothetical protein
MIGLIDDVWVTLPLAVASEATGRRFCFLAAIDEAMRLTTWFDLNIFDLVVVVVMEERASMFRSLEV